MFKKILPISVLTLTALFYSAFAQQKQQLDVIYRDFPVTADGFEEFMGCDDIGKSDSKFICFNNDSYWPCDTQNGSLKYGQCNGGPASGKRGYSVGPDKLGSGNYTDLGQCNQWEYGGPDNPDGYVKVTTGMVGNTLEYDISNCPEDDKMDDPDGDRDFIKYRYCARPRPGNGNCGSGGSRITNWFSGYNSNDDIKVIRDVIELERQTNDGTYLINHDYNRQYPWNDDGSDNGFFPLDKKEGTFGRQSLNFWCPPSASYTLNENCGPWRSNGGPKDPDAGRRTAENKSSIKNKLHNYGFSAAGSGTFIYDDSKNDVFEFIGDDDMWIFIDGELVADLGGVHQAAPARIVLKEYASSKGWASPSTHAINFFYMDRNTDGSNFRLKFSLNGLSTSRFGSPVIKKSETTISDDGSVSTSLYVSTKVDLKDVKDRFMGQGNYGIIVNVFESKKICAYRLDEIEYVGPAGADGQLYKIKGKVVCDNKEQNLATGDSLSFNTDCNVSSSQTLYDNSSYCLSGNPISSESGRLVDKIAMAPNSNKLQLPNPSPQIPDPEPSKPPFPGPEVVFGAGSRGDGVMSTMLGGGGLAPGFSGVNPKSPGSDKVHTFGNVGDALPSNRTGELILTAFPSASDPSWQEIAKGKFFGLPPSANGENQWYGIADPSKPNEVDGQTTGGYPFVKNGLSDQGEGSANGSMQLAPTRCVATINGEKAKVNCLNFNMVALQPFQLAVTVYDQLGNFVTQYRETISEQEFRYVTQGPNYIQGVERPTASIDCVAPTPDNYGDSNVLTTNGRVNVSVNIYPFSQTGRKFGNGVYLLKIDRVDLPFKGCYSDGLNSGMGIYPFIRYHSDAKFGWLRSTK